MNLEIYYLNIEQVKEINEINNLTKKYAVVCNYGDGNFISTDIDNYEDYKTHSDYIKSENILKSIIEIEDEYGDE